jgi:hypothetical protein
MPPSSEKSEKMDTKASDLVSQVAPSEKPRWLLTIPAPG